MCHGSVDNEHDAECGAMLDFHTQPASIYTARPPASSDQPQPHPNAQRHDRGHAHARRGRTIAHTRTQLLACCRCTCSTTVTSEHPRDRLDTAFLAMQKSGLRINMAEGTILQRRRVTQSESWLVLLLQRLTALHAMNVSDIKSTCVLLSRRRTRERAPCVNHGSVEATDVQQRDSR